MEPARCACSPPQSSSPPRPPPRFRPSAADRLSDSQFVKAAHCRGLASGDDATSLDALIKAQKRGRSDHILDRAYNARADAERLARTDASAAQATLASDCGQFMG